MQCFKKIHTANRFLRNASHPIVIVPTMGALHEGHGALIKRGRKLAGRDGTLVVSLFVNPTQFALGEDLARYPRRQKEDLALCKANGADMVFMPDVEQMYSPEHSVFVEETKLSQVLCGKSRPGHFRGVCTVVAKLFNICIPDIAVFGQKDWQQLAIIRKMVEDLNFHIRIVAHPTVREADGLAMSSRNTYLTATERVHAASIYKSLCEIKKHAQNGERFASRLNRKLHNRLQNVPGVIIDYAEIVDPNTLSPIKKIDHQALAIVAVKLGVTRLIDNMLLQPSEKRLPANRSARFR